MKQLSKNKLIVRWDKRQNDVIISYPKSKSDAHFILHRLFGVIPGEGLMAELEERGYDTTTFRFQIELKEPSP